MEEEVQKIAKILHPACESEHWRTCVECLLKDKMFKVDGISEHAVLFHSED